MKLLTEIVDQDSLEYLEEKVDNSREPIYRIKGPFVEAEVQNRNKRIYPRSIMEREVLRFNQDKIAQKRAIGELDHPPTPTVSMKDACHLIESLTMDGNIGYGVAKFLDTPMGRIGKSLIREGVRLGVSSRAVGSLRNGVVGEDLRLLTVDVVSDPSAPSAYVEGILENKEYIMEGNMIVEVAIDTLEKNLAKDGSKYLAEELSKFITTLRHKL